jgi:hypothetical protein
MQRELPLPSIPGKMPQTIIILAANPKGTTTLRLD